MTREEIEAMIDDSRNNNPGSPEQTRRLGQAVLSLRAQRDRAQREVLRAAQRLEPDVNPNASAGVLAEGVRLGVDDLESTLATVTRERDEARAEVAALKEAGGAAKS